MIDQPYFCLINVVSVIVSKVYFTWLYSERTVRQAACTLHGVGIIEGLRIGECVVKMAGVASESYFSVHTIGNLLVFHVLLHTELWETA